MTTRAMLASIVRREAYVLAYIDAFWLIAWVSLLGILLVLLMNFVADLGWTTRSSKQP
jgi:MFS transporter, DHA2 family, multidrug resistance protein